MATNGSKQITHPVCTIANNEADNESDNEDKPSIETKLDWLCNRFKEFQSTVDKLTTTVIESKNEIVGIKAEVKDLRTNDIADLRVAYKNVEKTIDSHDERITKLERQLSQEKVRNESLQDSINDIQRQYKKNSVYINNLPDKTNDENIKLTLRPPNRFRNYLHSRKRRISI